MVNRLLVQRHAVLKGSAEALSHLSLDLTGARDGAGDRLGLYNHRIVLALADCAWLPHREVLALLKDSSVMHLNVEEAHLPEQWLDDLNSKLCLRHCEDRLARERSDGGAARFLLASGPCRALLLRRLFTHSVIRVDGRKGHWPKPLRSSH